MAKEIQLTDEQIRTRAYYLWEADGRPNGRDWEYWHRAQQELTARQETSAPTTAKKTTVVAAEPKRKTSARTPAYA